MPVIDLGSVVGPQGPQGAAGATGAQGIQGNPGPNQVTDQTSTNLNGVLFGSQSRVTVKPVDSDPTADSTNLVSSGGTDKAIKGRTPVYGMGKNLLDNPVFIPVDGLPVNQRGQSNYSSGYTIDRWKIVTNGTVNLTSSGISYTRTASGNALAQFMTPSRVTGRSITASLLLGNGTLVSQTADIPASPVAYTYYINKTEENVNLTYYLNGAGLFVFQISTTNDSAVVIQAAKLELGTEQTLAHQENGVWVLNEIPDYGEELRKCQRYYVSLKPRAGGTPLIGVGMVVSNTQAAVTIPLPVTLNGASVTLAKSGTVKLWHGNTVGSSSVDVSGFVGSAVSGNSVTVTVSVSGGLNLGEVCALQFRSEDADLSFSCEL